MMAENERVRLVALGGAGVGKSCLLKRFLFGSFSDKYRSTVEDLYSREFSLGGASLVVDFLDTAGDLQFPAMRRLSIATASAFLIVFAVDSRGSLEELKQCIQEIREQRSDVADVPIVIAANKLDLASKRREVGAEDAAEWLAEEFPLLRVRVAECSARDDHNVRGVFRSFLELAQRTPSAAMLKRRSSAHAARGGGRRGDTGAGACGSSSSDSLMAAEMAAAAAAAAAASTSNPAPPKPRSRSLIRRSSRKAKQQVRQAQSGEDCSVS